MARDLIDQPFYWIAPDDPQDWKTFAKTGWYQWTDAGLAYLGDGILQHGSRLSLNGGE